MAIRQVINSVIKPAIRKVIDAIMNAISAYRFDGFDDYAVLAYRAINPDGDNTYEFWTPSEIVARRVIISQSVAATFDREFNLYVFNSQLFIIRGGTITSLQGVTANTRYGIVQTGNSVQLRLGGIDGQLIRTITANSGAVREPLAQTIIGARGTTTTPADFFNGLLYDVKINGITYPISDRNQSIQLPSPSNLGAELITQTVLENPIFVENQWTYLGGGRWQLIGDGTANAVQFLGASFSPDAGFLEFEIESISGGTLTCTAGTLTGSIFNTVGVKRYFYTSKTTGTTIQFKRGTASTPTSCIIKNISFKPLITVNSTELVSNGDFSAGTANWLAGGSATFSVTSGQATVGYVAGQTSRIEQSRTIEAGSYYELTATAVSISGLSGAFLQVLRGAAGSFATVAEASLNTAGQLRLIFLAPATDAIIRLRTGDTTNIGTIVWDNVSLRKLDSLCNPLTLVNANDFWWSTVGAESRDVYVFDGVDDYATLPYRAINPDGDIDIEWEQGDVPTAGVREIVAQSESTSFSSREFVLRWDSGLLTVTLGGALVISPADSITNAVGKWRFTISGATVSVFRNNALVFTNPSRTRGTAREPAAITRIATRSSGGTLTGFFGGIFNNIRINGTLWRMADRNQAIQLPEPSGLGAELLDSSPYVVPPTFTNTITQLSNGFIANQSANGGTRAAKAFSLPSSATTILAEFEVVSKSPDVVLTLFVRDGLAAGSGTVTYTSPSINVGKQRLIIQNNSTSAEKNLLFSTNVPCTYEIRNISFKPLIVVNSTELVPNGDFSAGTTSWTALGSATFTVTSGQASVGYVAGQNSRVEQFVTLEADRYYQITADVVSISGVTAARLLLLRGAAGSYTTIGQVDASAAGKINFVVLAPATDAIISMRTSDGLNNGTIVWDNVSVRKLDSLCNPMQLINTTSDRWREIDK